MDPRRVAGDDGAMDVPNEPEPRDPAEEQLDHELRQLDEHSAAAPSEAREWPPIGYADATVPARIAQAALGLNAVMYVLMAATFAVDPLGIGSVEVWEIVDAFYEIVTPAEIPIRLLTAIPFLVWIHRTSKNAHAMSDLPLQHSPGAAVGYWFVPCGNLWLPFQVVTELDRVSSHGSAAGATSPLIASWWATSISARPTRCSSSPARSTAWPMDRFAASGSSSAAADGRCRSATRSTA